MAYWYLETMDRLNRKQIDDNARKMVRVIFSLSKGAAGLSVDTQLVKRWVNLNANKDDFEKALMHAVEQGWIDVGGQIDPAKLTLTQKGLGLGREMSL